MVIDELADVHGQVSVVCATVILFRNEESVGSQKCLDKTLVCYMDICGVRSTMDETFNMLFKGCPIGLLVICYCFNEVRGSSFDLVTYAKIKK